VASPGSVLVVCTGNVCRSPYIERRLAHELAGTGITVTSAGTRALVDQPMDPSTHRLLQQAGIDTAGFVARQLTAELVAQADLVVTAAREHRSVAAQLHPSALRRVVTLRDLSDLLEGADLTGHQPLDRTASWARQVVDAAAMRRGIVPARQEGVDVTDPIGGPPELFAQMAAEVDAVLPAVVAALRAGPRAT
jgi:protein-tyrosine phosphatase